MACHDEQRRCCLLGRKRQQRGENRASDDNVDVSESLLLNSPQRFARDLSLAPDPLAF